MQPSTPSTKVAEFGRGDEPDDTRSDHNCSSCGYGVGPRARLPDRCPMCGAARWIRRPRVVRAWNLELVR